MSTELFSEVVGQAAAVAMLRASARRPVHAYLLVGPAGSGLDLAARDFAAALLCPKSGCGTCLECERVRSGGHPDVIAFERTGAAIGIDEVRRIVTLAQRRPFAAERQVLIVRDIHLAVRTAPALLKTIEEPPGASVFVLLADEIPPELVTIASRCVVIRFMPLTVELVASELVASGVDAELATLVATVAAGNLDRARMLATDANFVARMQRWASVPTLLDGSGVTAMGLAKELLGGLDSGLEPLRLSHEGQRERHDELATAWGERPASGRKDLFDNQRREERRWRTDELRAGLGVLARTYRNRLAEVGDAEVGERRRRLAQLSLAVGATADFDHNPNESLLVERLLVALSER